MQRIEADVLITGTNDVVKNGCVLIDGTKISFAGPIESAPKQNYGDVTTNVRVIMPGMWDAHTHFLGVKTSDLSEDLRTPTAVLAARAAKDAERALAAGFTSVRETGGLGVYIAKVSAEGTLNAPHVYAAGAALSQTGGHGDVHSFPIDFVLRRFEEFWGAKVLCDGVPECLKAARSQLRSGAKLIKICASGGVLSELDHPTHQQFSGEEMKAIVEEAARAERIVAAHCHGKPGIMTALASGCKTIEHGTYLDEEAADMMIEKGAILVPTRFIFDRLLKFAKQSGLPEYAYQKLVTISDRHKEAMKLAMKKGVKIVLGTDIFTSGEETAVPWGMNAHELGHLVEAGMSPLQAIQAATSLSPETLGPQAPKSGQLKTGYDADMISVTQNPLSNPTVLASKQNITHVWKSGKLVKEPKQT
ncbi:amidohydrolase family protein [Candidatus Bathyarchaeota archaeon]|nr:MAG: amidohydrolase family protein [Candidatus Bathyarchaeota archaeon]